MNLMKTLVGIALSATMIVPAVASARDCDRDRDHDGWHDRDRDRDGWRDRDEWMRRNPRPAMRQGGHYEVRTVQQWVDGSWVQVYVPEECHGGYHGRWRRPNFCTAAHYESRWQDGHYENVNQWVFVADAQTYPYPQYGDANYRTYPGAQVTVNGGNWTASANW